MNFRECGCQFTDSLGKSVDWHPHSQNSGQGLALPNRRMKDYIKSIKDFTGKNYIFLSDDGK